LALRLKRHGITRVRPLEGGFFGWRDLGLPLQEHLVTIDTVTSQKAAT
jgi:3-mercaptopyruvate sulfurtransferase SseA